MGSDRRRTLFQFSSMFVEESFCPHVVNYAVGPKDRIVPSMDSLPPNVSIIRELPDMMSASEGEGDHGEADVVEGAAGIL